MLFSLNGRREFDNVIKSTPYEIGPGSYEVSKPLGAEISRNRGNAPFGSKSVRSTFPPAGPDGPSPGDYSSKPLNRGSSIMSVFKSDAERKIYDISDNPGPGRYSQPDTWRDSPLKGAIVKKTIKNR